MAQRKRNNIEFSRPEEPSFLKKMKNQMGLRGDDIVTIDTKKEELDRKNLDYRDEEPVYVLDEKSNVTEKELEMFKEKNKQEKEYEKDNEITEQRIIFKKPIKIDTNNDNDKQASNMKNNQKKNLSDLKAANKSKLKTVKNSSLLSFDDDDNDDSDEDD